MASNAKPLLIDLFVSNRKDSLEYLSSMVILKGGDDLRKDAAVLQVFRLMNKIWKGIEWRWEPILGV